VAPCLIEEKTLQKRPFGKTGWQVSEIGFGAWAIGGSWGDVSDRDAEAALNAALDQGMTFIDTADVYGDGRSERLIARVLKSRGRDGLVVATKAGRKVNPHVSAGYTPAVLEQYIDDSLRNLEVDALDVVQLHCPPSEVYYRPEIFEALDKMVAKGKLKSYGVSVENVEQANIRSRASRSSSICSACARSSASSRERSSSRSRSSRACRSRAAC
jgi:aryl-alcohol dehydrogenase-like predicted oxidoreductase